MIKWKLFVYLTFFINTVLYLNAQGVKLEAEPREVYASIGTGIAYSFNFSADMVNQSDIAFFEVPLSFNAVFRLQRGIALSTGISGFYSYHNYRHKGVDTETHSLFIDIPFEVKFYPFASREVTHYHFYIGAGFFIRGWPVNYYVMSSSDSEFSGNAYFPENSLIYPGDAYTPVNVGTSLSLGNVFMFNETSGGGMEIAFKYLFLPYINGYASKSPYRFAGSDPYLNFTGSIGIKIFLQFILSKKPS